MIKSTINLGVGAVVLSNGKTVLVKEAQPPFRGKWNFPLGKLEHESIVDGTIREVEEETGYRIKLTGFLGIYQNIPSADKNTVIILFTGEPVSGKLSYDSGEVSEAKWFTVEEVLDIKDSVLVHPDMKKTLLRAIKDKRPLDSIVLF